MYRAVQESEASAVPHSAYLDSVLGYEFVFPFRQHLSAHLVIESGQHEVGRLILKCQSLGLAG